SAPECRARPLTDSLRTRAKPRSPESQTDFRVSFDPGSAYAPGDAFLVCLRRRSIPGIHTEYVHLEKRMSVPHALLALLREGPKYGLRLQSEFEARTGEVWPLNVGQVYTTLQRLERDGLVEADGEGERSRKQKRYRITAAGAQELSDWLHTPPGLLP